MARRECNLRLALSLQSSSEILWSAAAWLGNIQMHLFKLLYRDEYAPYHANSGLLLPSIFNVTPGPKDEV